MFMIVRNCPCNTASKRTECETMEGRVVMSNMRSQVLGGVLSACFFACRAMSMFSRSRSRSLSCSFCHSSFCRCCCSRMALFCNYIHISSHLHCLVLPPLCFISSKHHIYTVLYHQSYLIIKARYNIYISLLGKHNSVQRHRQI